MALPFFFTQSEQGEGLRLILKNERSEIESRFYDLCKEVVAASGLSLYDVEYLDKEQLLRVTIINPATKTADLDECVRIDRALTEPIESESWMPEELVLEVSSPGIYRSLSSLEHFQMVIGEPVKVLLTKRMEGQEYPAQWHGEKRVIAKLLAANEKNITVSGPDGSSEVSFTYEEMRKANLETTI